MFFLRRHAAHLLLVTLAACSGDAGRAMMLGTEAQQELEGGQLQMARETIIAALKERDDLPDLQLLKARIELASNRAGPAFDAFSAALSLEATNPEALQGVAQLGLRTGHVVESEAAADHILALQPNQTDALLVKGLLALVRNRPANAIEFADRILAASPGNEGGVILKARALYLLGNLAGAVEFLNKQEPAIAQKESVIRTKLELHRQTGDAPAMHADFATLTKLQPKDFDLRLDEANLRYKTGDKLGARGLLRAALFDLNPVAEQVSRIAALWGEYDTEPLDAGDLRALAASPNEAARVEVARYFLSTKRNGVARALVSGGHTLVARSLSALAAVADGDTAVGAAEAERILAQDKTQCDALLARSAAASAKQLWSEAILAAQTVAAECPDKGSAPIALARAYDGRRDEAGVRRAFADGIMQNPQDPAISAAFRTWLEANGQSRQAIAEARRLTRKAPALFSGWLAYRGVCQRQHDESCAADAQTGLEQATKLLGVDLKPGTQTLRNLVVRLPQQ
jgi:Tfp pilus assembly protein PilF